MVRALGGTVNCVGLAAYPRFPLCLTQQTCRWLRRHDRFVPESSVFKTNPLGCLYAAR
jgi:hypothetical protein